MRDFKDEVIGFRGIGWYGQVYNHRLEWLYAFTVDFGDRCVSRGGGGCSSAAAAERSMRAHLAIVVEGLVAAPVGGK